MASTTSFLAAVVAAIGYFTTEVQGHGYMLIPKTEFKGTATGAWSVQISPQFQANWESVKNDDELIALYVEKAKEAGYANNIRKLLDSDTSLYGANCGFSNPDATPKDPPSDGTATFERGLAHHGPCEIWLDDTMVLHNDDCAKAFSVEDYMSIKSVFKPIDYSSCSSSGCMFRFYWLAFQGSTSGKYVWQIYKNCIPLTGPGAGKTSTTSTNTTQSTDTTQLSSNTPESQTNQGSQADTPETQTTPAPQAETPSGNTPKSPLTSETQAPMGQSSPETNTPQTQTQATPAPEWQSTPSPQTWGATQQTPSTNEQNNQQNQSPTVTNSPQWTNAPEAQNPGTVAPFTQTQGNTDTNTPTASNTPNSYSFSNGVQATNAPETAGEAAQMPMTTKDPSFSF